MFPGGRWSLMDVIDAGPFSHGAPRLRLPPANFSHGGGGNCSACRNRGRTPSDRGRFGGRVFSVRSDPGVGNDLLEHQEVGHCVFGIGRDGPAVSNSARERIRLDPVLVGSLDLIYSHFGSDRWVTATETKDSGGEGRGG